MRLLSTLSLLAISLSLSAQYKIGILPRISPDKGAYEKIGYTGIEITYGSPSANNRTIWGDLIPYDLVWRAGANNATRLDITEDILVEGKRLPAGRYALFIIPHQNEDWTVIFNKNYQQWGAFQYDESMDQLRVDVKPCDHSYTEKLHYEIEGQGFEDGVISMYWADKRIDINIKTHYLDILQEEIEYAASQHKAPINSVIYLQGAEHLLRRYQYLDVAEQWIDKSISLFSEDVEWDPNYYPREYVLGHIYWIKAKILATSKDYNGAIKYATKMKDIDGRFTYYSEENEFEKIDKTIAEWRSKRI